MCTVVVRPEYDIFSSDYNGYRRCCVVMKRHEKYFLYCRRRVITARHLSQHLIKNHLTSPMSKCNTIYTTWGRLSSNQ